MASADEEKRLALKLADFPFGHNFQKRWTFCRVNPSDMMARDFAELIAQGRIMKAVQRGQIRQPQRIDDLCWVGGVRGLICKCSHCNHALRILQCPFTKYWHQHRGNDWPEPCVQHRDQPDYETASPFDERGNIMTDGADQRWTLIESLLPNEFVEKPEKCSHCVYALISDRDLSAIRYVGQTPNMVNRLERHYRGCKSSPDAIFDWISIEFQAGYFVRPKLLAWTHESDVRSAEKAWIVRMAQDGHDLFNHANNPCNQRKVQ